MTKMYKNEARVAHFGQQGIFRALLCLVHCKKWPVDGATDLFVNRRLCLVHWKMFVYQSIHPSAIIENRSRADRISFEWGEKLKGEILDKVQSNDVCLSGQTCHSQPLWPDVGMKSSPNFPKVAQKLSTAGFTLKVTFLYIAQKGVKYLGYFWKKNSS